MHSNELHKSMIKQDSNHSIAIVGAGAMGSGIAQVQLKRDTLSFCLTPASKRLTAARINWHKSPIDKSAKEDGHNWNLMHCRSESPERQK